MKIFLRYFAHQIHISPDPAILTIGSPVEWELFSDGLNLPQLRWTVYFDHGTPFPQGQHIFTAVTLLAAIPSRSSVIGMSHVGQLGPFVAVSSGDYKYGVRVEAFNQIMADDDPFLIVR